jgi:hypothetical protein
VLLLAGVRTLHGVAASPNLPVILEPSAEGQVINFFDVHMVTAPFVPSQPGESHLCSDWQIGSLPSAEIVWKVSCATGGSAVHIHLGDGEFSGSLTGAHQLDADRDHLVRVRFQVRTPSGASETSAWAERRFRTSAASQILPLLQSDAARIPAPSWTDDTRAPIVLPADGSVRLRLEAVGAGTLLEFSGSDLGPNICFNPEALSSHGPVRVSVRSSGGGAVFLPASRLHFADASGADRAIFLPRIVVPAGKTVFFWIAENGGSFKADSLASVPSFDFLARQPPVPWTARQPGFDVVPVATGFQLPVNIAFVPSPGPAAEDPLFYVSELYGGIKVVTRSGEVRDYARDLLNFDPEASFPGIGERGVTGLVVEPGTGDLFVGLVYEDPPGSGTHYPAVIRLHSDDGGRTVSSRTTVLEMTSDPVGASHQISNLSIGPDGKLYVHIGDGFDLVASQSLASFRGKILRLDLDGSAPPDNPFYDSTDGFGAADYVLAYGLRNPFGGAWRAADGFLYFVENGPLVDRLARVVAGTNYLWDGSDLSMFNFATYNWTAANSPVNIAFVQPQTFGGSGFPSTRMGRAYVTESGPTYALGPQATGKRISEFAFDAQGNRTAGPLPLVEYNGAGRASVAGLAAGPDGLYFSDLYKDVDALLPYERGASIFRVRWIGVASFSADSGAGPAPLTVRFSDGSDMPRPLSWRWEFGDGRMSDERNPTHTYTEPGTFDVRLTVTGADGEAVHQKSGFVVVEPTAPSTKPCHRRHRREEIEADRFELPCS